MLRKLGAALLVVGLCLPYGCDVRPITGVWSEPDLSSLFVGIPVLLLIAYALHAFLPAIARFHERHGPMLHGVFRAVYFVLLGGYVMDAPDNDAWPYLIAAAAVTGALLLWQQRRGTKAQRLPLLLLTAAGVPVVYYFAGFTFSDGDGLRIGGWILSAGYAVAVVAEVLTLRGAPPIQHGG